MGYFKTHVVGKIFYLVITVLTIVAFALYVANTTRAYYADSNIAITVMAVAALVCEIRRTGSCQRAARNAGNHRL